MSKGQTKQTKKKVKRGRSNKPGEHIGLDWEGDIIYKNLPRVSDQHGHCYKCRTTNNPRIEITTTTGKRIVFICKECKRFMRPLFDNQKIVNK